ncbi:MAG TPA: bifunctional protein-serine/threonine kinase/phosphatase [Usitatibacter sp.]|nr:bifunctional protein-serine/threonine kinase/phosphatase [Usitatibacter sp.]
MLAVRVGQHSERGRKEVNQDFHGATIPAGPPLLSKGVAVALADGIGSSAVSRAASELAVQGLMEDYYCTSEAWSVRKSVKRVLTATNSWLHSRTQQGPLRNDMERGYVCTLSAVVIKGATAHVFHVGDSRVYRLQKGVLEPVTQEHRVRVSDGKTYLARAMGFNAQIEIDYHTLPIERGDVFVLATDGVHEHVTAHEIAEAIAHRPDDLDAAARAIVAKALDNGSPDNLTAQVVRVESLAEREGAELHERLLALPPPPILSPRDVLDGWRIMRELHGSPRSHIYLAVDAQTGRPAIIKTPAIDRQEDTAYLERFLMEEWIARRIDSAHVLKPIDHTRERTRQYVVTEYIDGQTLGQWMIDHPRPDLESVRRIVEQIAKGLQAMHRMEMLHRDLRPGNVMIDTSGTVKIIDFGAVSVAGLRELRQAHDHEGVLGTEQYTAPECLLGEAATPQSDLFSLGVIAYQMLSGRLPYGADVARARTRAAQAKLRYRSVLGDDRDIPAWIDEVLRRAVHPSPARRYEELSELVHDLRHPHPRLTGRPAAAPLIERDGLVFWKAVSSVLALALFAVAFLHFGR